MIDGRQSFAYVLLLEGAIMTADEFRADLRDKSLPELLDMSLHNDEPPYVLEDQDRWDAFRDSIVKNTGAEKSGIRIVGSARFGFSLRPNLEFRKFSDTSDIDVVVVSPDLFDSFWISLLSAAYPRHRLAQGPGGWLLKERRELYGGWLTPLKIRLDGRILGPKATPALEFKEKWFNALKEAARFPTRRHEDVQGRLYRTWTHADLYHQFSLTELKASIWGAGQ
jgi:hypothetical protein